MSLTLSLTYLSLTLSLTLPLSPQSIQCQYIQEHSLTLVPTNKRNTLLWRASYLIFIWKSTKMYPSVWNVEFIYMHLYILHWTPENNSRLNSFRSTKIRINSFKLWKYTTVCVNYVNKFNVLFTYIDYSLLTKIRLRYMAFQHVENLCSIFICFCKQ